MTAFEYPLLAAERRGAEGWLDTAVRLERERGLTDAERVEADNLWRDFVKAMGVAAAAFRAGSAARRASIGLGGG